jgi:hypothetical protein
MKSRIFALSIALACTGVLAQSKSKDDATYIEVGYTSAQYNTDLVSGLSNANHLMITLGKNISANYAIEGVLANGMSDSTTTSPGYTVNAKLASSYGLYVKPKAQITNAVEVFARVGYFSAKPNFTVPSDTTQNLNYSGTSLSYGLGASLKVADNIYGSLDWMQSYKKDGIDIKGVGLSVGYKF